MNLTELQGILDAAKRTEQLEKENTALEQEVARLCEYASTLDAAPAFDAEKLAASLDSSVRVIDLAVDTIAILLDEIKAEISEVEKVRAQLRPDAGKSNGVPTRARGGRRAREWSDEDLLLIQGMRLAGHTWDHCAQTFGLSNTGLRSALKRGLEKNPSLVDDVAAAAAYTTGCGGARSAGQRRGFVPRGAPEIVTPSVVTRGEGLLLAVPATYSDPTRNIPTSDAVNEVLSGLGPLSTYFDLSTADAQAMLTAMREEDDPQGRRPRTTGACMAILGTTGGATSGSEDELWTCGTSDEVLTPTETVIIALGAASGRAYDAPRREIAMLSYFFDKCGKNNRWITSRTKQLRKAVPGKPHTWKTSRDSLIRYGLLDAKGRAAGRKYRLTNHGRAMMGNRGLLAAWAKRRSQDATGGAGMHEANRNRRNEEEE